MSKLEVDRDIERRMVLVAGILWIGAGGIAFIAGQVANAFPALYVLFPFMVGMLLVAWYWRMGEQAEEHAAEASTDSDTSFDLPDGEPQPA